MKTYKLLLSIFLLLTITSCTQKPTADPEHIEEIKAWDERRIERLREEDGWLNLAGLFWFKDDENKIGSAKDNDIVFPSGPDYIGSMILSDSTVTIKVNPGVNVINNGIPVTEMTLDRRSVRQSHIASNRLT
jgi:uncharacterized protein